MLSQRKTEALEIPQYTKNQIIEYFNEVAFGFEYPGCQEKINKAVIKKWTVDPRIKIHGKPTAEDKKTLERCAAQINTLIETIQYSIVKEKQNIDIYFVPESEFKKYLASYQPTNYGYSYIDYDSQNRIYYGIVLISSNRISQESRSHLIRNMLTATLGFMQESPRYPESTFYNQWRINTKYAPIDTIIMKTLYREDIKPGMTMEETNKILLKKLPESVYGQ